MNAVEKELTELQLPQDADITALSGEEALAKAESLNEVVCKVFDELGDEDPSSDVRTKIGDVNRAIEQLELKAKAYKESEELRKQAGERKQSYGRVANDLPLSNKSVGENGRILSIGEQFINSPEMKAFLESIAKGEIGERTQFVSPHVAFKSLITGTSSTSGGAFIETQVTGIFDPGTIIKPLTVRDLITVTTTNSDTVKFVQQGTFTNNADITPESTATNDANGVKPESAIAYTPVEASVKNIAHWVPITRQALADAGQLQGYVNTLMMYGLEEKLNSQVLVGDGTGDNFTGITATSGISTQAWDTDVLTTTRKARTKVGTQGRARPTAWVMNPVDWEEIDLAKDGEQRYYYGGPSVLGTPRLWGVPVVEDEAMTENTTVIADWKLAYLWDRQQATMYTTNSHSDFFVRNIIALLTELRAAFGVLRPAAFVSTSIVAP